jgi:hypothetical protein
MSKFSKVILITAYLFSQFIFNISANAQEIIEPLVNACFVGEVISSCSCKPGETVYNVIDSKDKKCGCPAPKIIEVINEENYCKNKTIVDNATAQTQATQTQNSAGVITIEISENSTSAVSSQLSTSSVDIITNIITQKYEISDPYTCGGNFTGKTNNPNAVAVKYVLFKTLTGAKAYEFGTAIKADRTFDYVIDYSKVSPDSYNVVYYGVNANDQPENPGNSYIANITNNCATLTSEVDSTQTQNAVTVMATPNVELAKGTSTIRTGGQSFNIFIFVFFLILSWKVSFSGRVND